MGGDVYFRTDAQIKNSKFKKGIRAWVYQVAATCGACYNGDKSTSIFYSDNNLQIRILFPTEERWGEFLNKMDDHLSHFQLVERLEFNRTAEEVRVSTRPRRIFARDYDSKDTDSENYSIAISRLTHLSARSHLDRTTEFQMVESSRLEDFVRLDVYKCHLRSQTAFPLDKDNINNWLWMSWQLHQRFDGLNTTQSHRVPQIAIRFVGIAEGIVETEGDTEWYRVDVAIECPQADIFEVVRHRIKEGVVVDEGRKEIATWVFVPDPNEFKRCLTYKYQETHTIWQTKPCGEEVTEQEACELRRSARLALQTREQTSESG